MLRWRCSYRRTFLTPRSASSLVFRTIVHIENRLARQSPGQAAHSADRFPDRPTWLYLLHTRRRLWLRLKQGRAITLSNNPPQT